MPEIPAPPESRTQLTPLETASKVVDRIRSTIPDRKKLGLMTASVGLAFLTACSGGESGKQPSLPPNTKPSYTVPGTLESRKEIAQQRIKTSQENIQQKRAVIASREADRKGKLATRRDNQKTATTPQILRQPESSTQPPLVAEGSSLVQLKTEIDQRFGIELRDGSEIHWEVQHMEQLKRILPSLPEQLYQKPFKTNAKLALLLTSEGGECCRVTGVAKDERVIVAVGREFFDNGEVATRQVLAHELTHYLQDFNKRSLFQDVNRDVFDGKFSEIADALKKKMKGMNKQYNDPGIFEKYFKYLYLIQPHNPIYTGGRDALYYRINYLLRPSEFLAVCSEQYVLGKEQFFSLFRGIFEEEKVGQLYDFTKREIFQETEY